MKAIEEIMSIINFGNNHMKINILEIKILKTASFQNLHNNVMNGRSDQVYRLLPSVSAWNSNGQPPTLSGKRDILATD